MEKKRSGWRTAGLIVGIGCLSMIVIVVGGVVIATMVARAQLRNLGDTDPRPVTRRIAIPAAEAVAATKPGAQETARVTPLRLTIELQEGNFTIRPGEPGSELQIEGEYAPGLYELTESVDTDPATGVTSARVRFHSTAPAWARFFGGIGGGAENMAELTVTIPRGALIDLTLQMNMGRSEIDLGGLTLNELSINASMGEHRIDFREPLAEGLRELRLNTSMGNIMIENLGNARAESITAHGSMGNVTASLGGAWPAGEEANIRFEQSMGELTVRVPSNVRLEADVRRSDGQSSTPAPSAQPDDPRAPTLRLRVTTSMGDARIVRY
jgi:hypothetical protein